MRRPATRPAARRVEALLQGWAECIAADGYFYYSAKPNAPHYIYDKMVGGLSDMRLFSASKPGSGIGHLRRITDWAVKNLERSQPHGRFGGTEWYTLSENLYRAYLATGDSVSRLRRGLALQRVLGHLRRKGDLFGDRGGGRRTGAYHAYSHVNTLGGAGADYLVKGDPRYLDTLVNAYDSLQANQFFATGGFGPDRTTPAPRQTPRMPDNTANTFETQCGCWAGFKMAKYLIAIPARRSTATGSNASALNGIGGEHSHVPRWPGLLLLRLQSARRREANIAFAWSCCTGTRPQAAADCCDLVYFKDKEHLYVNLFTPSTVRWSVRDTRVTVRQTTQFPEEPRTQFTVDVAQPVAFGLRIRCPDWLAGPITARINGAAVPIEKDAQNWAVLSDTWSSGDRLAIELPMRLRTSSFAGRRYPAALLFGPVALAVHAASPNFAKKIDLVHPEQSLLPVSGEALTWRLAGDPAVLARPFYAYKEGEPYYLYFDPAAGNRVSHHSLSYQGSWHDGSAFHFTNSVGATVECKFQGTGVRWLGSRFDDAGKAEVSIDGKFVATVDQYGPGRNLPFQWSQRNLKPGAHTIRLRLLEEKPPRSKDRYINVAGFEPINDQQAD